MEIHWILPVLRFPALLPCIDLFFIRDVFRCDSYQNDVRRGGVVLARQPITVGIGCQLYTRANTHTIVSHTHCHNVTVTHTLPLSRALSHTHTHNSVTHSLTHHLHEVGVLLAAIGTRLGRSFHGSGVGQLALGLRGKQVSLARCTLYCHTNTVHTVTYTQRTVIFACSNFVLPSANRRSASEQCK